MDIRMRLLLVAPDRGAAHAAVDTHMVQLRQRQEHADQVELVQLHHFLPVTPTLLYQGESSSLRVPLSTAPLMVGWCHSLSWKKLFLWPVWVCYWLAAPKAFFKNKSIFG
jgi:hypothetical protein